MIDVKTWSLALVIAGLAPAIASAQTASARDGAAGAASAATVMGDTGLWFVSAADVLPAGMTTAGVVAASEPRDAGGVNASYGAVSIARGLADRAEVFGTWQMTTAVDGIRARGDLLAGAKLQLASERRGAPIGLAVRGVVKLPTGNEDAGISTGKPDLLTEIVASRRFGPTEITGSSGLVLRGDPRGLDVPNGVRSGIGFGVMAHPSVRVFTEVHGETGRGEATGARLVSAFDTPATAAAGVAWTVGAVNATVGVNRAIAGRGDAQGVGALIRVGYRPGTRRAVPPAAPVGRPAASSTVTAPPPAPPGAPAGSRAGGEGAGTLDLALDDVQFDLDQYTLRPEALPILDRAASALRNDPTLRLQIDGHTCEIGTSQYNLALGERRAFAVRDYLIGRGIAAERLQTTSFGEEHPKHGLSTEAARALNRRAELRTVVLASSR